MKKPCHGCDDTGKTWSNNGLVELDCPWCTPKPPFWKLPSRRAFAFWIIVCVVLNAAHALVLAWLRTQ